MIVLGLSGYKQCGKDTAAQYLVQYGFQRYGFADALREMALAIDPTIDLVGASVGVRSVFGDDAAYYSDIIAKIGYEEAKKIPDLRRFLQRLGTEGVRGTFGDTAWVDALKRRLLLDNPARVVISDVRFHSEAAFIRSIGGRIWRMVRPGHGGDDSHQSEREIAELEVDVEVVAESVEALHARVDALYRADRMLNA